MRLVISNGRTAHEFGIDISRAYGNIYTARGIARGIVLRSRALIRIVSGIERGAREGLFDGMRNGARTVAKSGARFPLLFSSRITGNLSKYKAGYALTCKRIPRENLELWSIKTLRARTIKSPHNIALGHRRVSRTCARTCIRNSASPCVELYTLIITKRSAFCTYVLYLAAAEESVGRFLQKA